MSITQDLWRTYDGPRAPVRCSHCKELKEPDGKAMCETCRELRAAFERRRNLYLKTRRAQLEQELKEIS